MIDRLPVTATPPSPAATTSGAAGPSGAPSAPSPASPGAGAITSVTPAPDLDVGVPLAALADGVPLAGRVGDEAVLLTRFGERCYAVGAACTHYGGPLARGIVVGESVRCPLHHAAFDLRTGRAERAPALDALPCYAVEVRGGRARVTGRVPAPAARPRPGASAPASVVIVGAGAAGVVAAETLRDEGYAGPITLLDEDPDAAVDRPNLSKDYLAGHASEDWVTWRSPEQLAAHDIRLRRARVGALAPARHEVQLADGDVLPYGALVLATGASPVRLAIPTDDARPLLTLRSFADARAIIAAAERAPRGRAVVIGASFIGLEVAAALVARGLAVHVVAPEARPLERVLGPELGDWVRALHEAHGVVFHLGRRPAATRARDVVLDDGAVLPADLVVAGVGVRPNVALAEGAGLAVDRGVAVDGYLRTTAPDVYAVGDVARWPDAASGEAVRVEHWVAAQRQAATAARNALGAGERFTAVPFFWSRHYRASVAYVGHAERWDRVAIDGDLAAGDATVRYLAGERVAAVATVGRGRASLEAELAMEGAIGAGASDRY